MKENIRNWIFTHSTVITIFFSASCSLLLSVWGTKLHLLLRIIILSVVTICVFSVLQRSMEKKMDAFFSIKSLLLVLLANGYVTISFSGLPIFRDILAGSKKSLLGTEGSLAVAIVTFIVLFPITLWIISWFRQKLLCQRHFEDTGSAVDWHLWIFLFMIVISVCLIYNFAYNPAIMSSDSRQHWEQAKSGIYNDALPLSYTLLIQFLTSYINHPMVISVLQSIFLAAIVASILCYCCKKGLSTKSAYIFALSFSVIPSTPLTTITLWKDVPYTICMLWLLFICARFYFDPGIYRAKISIYVEAVVCMIGIGLLRHNGILSFFTTFVLLFFLVRPNRRLLISFAVTLGAYIVFQGPVMSMMNVPSVYQTRPELKYTAMAHDMMGVYYSGGSLPESGEQYLRSICDLDGANREVYRDDNASNADWYKEPFEVPDTVSFICTYLKAYAQEPYRMASATIIRNQYTWKVHPVINGINSTGDSAKIFGFERKITIITRALNRYLSLAFTQLSSPFFICIAWSSGLWLCLMLLFGVAAWMSGVRKGFLLFLPTLSHWFSLIVASAWFDFRYVWCIMINIIFFILFFLTVERPTTESKKEIA